MFFLFPLFYEPTILYTWICIWPKRMIYSGQQQDKINYYIPRNELEVVTEPFTEHSIFPSSAKTGPSSQMRSQPPILFSLPVNLQEKNTFLTVKLETIKFSWLKYFFSMKYKWLELLILKWNKKNYSFETDQQIASCPIRISFFFATTVK